MKNALTESKARALMRPDIRCKYDRLAEEFAFLDDILKARTDAGLSQTEVAARIGSTQSAVARLESASGGHSPFIATLQRYASALGYTLQVRLVKEQNPTIRSPRTHGRFARGAERER
jgi:transcriptional regulator with XRE-family HTH domain